MQIKKPSKGLGDTIDKFTSATGIKTVAEAVSKLVGAEGCGCEERKQYLNELFPYKEKYRKFRIIKDFVLEGNYKKGEIYSINKEHPLQPHIINLTEKKYLEEI